MKTLRARIAAILLVAAMGITFSACNNKKDDVTPATAGTEVSDNGESAAEGDNSADNNNAAENNNNNQPAATTADDGIELTTGESGFMKQEITFGIEPKSTDENVVQDATEPATEPATIVVTKEVIVTEAGGEAATDAKGSTVTEVVTEVQPVTEPYTPAIMSDYIWWLDMDKGPDGEYNKVFNGEIYVFEFKIKENTPDGNYAITLSDPDFVNWEEEQLDVKTVDSYVTVGDAVPTPTSQVQPGQFTISVAPASGNVGDTVKVVLSASDNPGLVGLLFKVAFDFNALELVNSYAGEALE